MDLKIFIGLVLIYMDFNGFAWNYMYLNSFTWICSMTEGMLEALSSQAESSVDRAWRCKGGA